MYGCVSLRCGHDAGNACGKNTEDRNILFKNNIYLQSVKRRQQVSTLTLKVDLLHDVLGLDALLLVVDEDLSVLVLRPAVFIHPHLYLCVCANRKQVQPVTFYSERNKSFRWESCILEVALCPSASAGKTSCSEPPSEANPEFTQLQFSNR